MHPTLLTGLILWGFLMENLDDLAIAKLILSQENQKEHFKN